MSDMFSTMHAHHFYW